MSCKMGVDINTALLRTPYYSYGVHCAVQRECLLCAAILSTFRPTLSPEILNQTRNGALYYIFHAFGIGPLELAAVEASTSGSSTLRVAYIDSLGAVKSGMTFDRRKPKTFNIWAGGESGDFQ